MATDEEMREFRQHKEPKRIVGDMDMDPDSDSDKCVNGCSDDCGDCTDCELGRCVRCMTCKEYYCESCVEQGGIVMSGDSYKCQVCVDVESELKEIRLRRDENGDYDE